MNQFQVTRTMLIDPVPTADSIETLYGEYLVPMSHSVSAMEPQHMVPGSWYDQYGRLIVREQANLQPVTPPKQQVRRQPNHPLPVRGIAIVNSLVDWVLSDCSIWKQSHTSCIDSFAEFVLPEYRGNIDFLELIAGHLVDVRTEVREFVGPDRWIMHFHTLRGRDIIVEKTIDFRIFDWERRKQAGEWK
jgi:hypothetical protein